MGDTMLAYAIDVLLQGAAKLASQARAVAIYQEAENDLSA